MERLTGRNYERRNSMSSRWRGLHVLYGLTRRDPAMILATLAHVYLTSIPEMAQNIPPSPAA